MDARRRRRVFALACAAAAGAVPTRAQTPSSEPIVISASRIPQPLKDVPASVTILGREQVEKAHARAIDQVLTKEAGALFDADTPDTSQPRTRLVGLRGASQSGRTLMLLDGVPFEDFQGNFGLWHMVNLESVERVEIVPGPLGSLYGSGAMGGVVNVLTRTPAKRSETAVSAGYGDLNTSNFNAAQGGSVGRFSYLAAGHVYHTDGYTLERFPTGKFPAASAIDRNRSAENAVGKLVYRPDERSAVTAFLDHGHDQWNRGRQFLLMDSRDTIGYSSYERTGDALDLFARFNIQNSMLQQGKDKSPFTYSDGIDIDSYFALGGTLQGTYHSGPAGKLTAGLDNSFNHLSRNLVFQVSTPRTQTSAGRQVFLSPFVRDELKLLDDKLIATLGGRFDWFQNYGGSELDTLRTKGFDQAYSARMHSWFSPSGGLLYRASDALSLRAAGGSAFHAPTAFQMYVSAIQPSGISVLSNPSLKPETVWSAEAGADWTPLPAVLAKATVFQNWSSNLIINKQVTATTQQRDNVDRVETHGTELELRWKAAKAWSTSLAYAYTHADIVYDSGLNAGHDLPVTPRNKFAWGLDFDEPKLFAAGLRLRYKDLFYVDPENTVLVHPYWNLDAGISRKFGRLEARLDVENVIDTHYDVFDLAATAPLMSPGRVVSGSLRASF